jgi:hypothetical protein
MEKGPMKVEEKGDQPLSLVEMLAIGLEQRMAEKKDKKKGEELEKKWGLMRDEM